MADWVPRARAAAWSLASGVALVACAQGTQRAPGGQRTDPVELDQEGGVYELTLSLSAQRSVDARAREMAALATGALLGPIIEGGAPELASNGTQVRGTCGATLISPSYAVTAAHCTDTGSLDVDALTLEMYRPTLALAATYLDTTELTGTFPDYSHGRVDAADGYLTDRYTCSVAARCGEPYGPALNCDSAWHTTSDVALLHCEGRPGDRYGYLDVAAADDLSAEVFMPWKHEIYDIPVEPTDDRWQHYTLLTADVAENYHYHGADVDGVEQNQLLPLVSVPFADGSSRTKLSQGNGYVMTELLGCHGSSGSGVLQRSQHGRWELLGPAVLGNEELNDYLCNHVPGLGGWSHPPGTPGLSYGGVEATAHVVEQIRADFEAGCDALPDGATSLFTHGVCVVANLNLGATNQDWVERLGSPTEPAPFDPWRGPVVHLAAGETVSLTGFSATADVEYRLGLTVWSGQDCAERPCPELVVHLGDEEAIRHDLVQLSSQLTPLAAAWTASATGAQTVILTANGGDLEVDGLTLVPEDHVTGFDVAHERLGVTLVDPQDDPSLPQPMRFVGDGVDGFSARLLGQERLLLTRQALLRAQRYVVEFDVAGGATLSCGLIEGGGAIALRADCSDGSATLVDALPGSAAFAAFFIENESATDAVLIDNLRLATQALADTDLDGVPDVRDACPDGALPAPAALASTLPASVRFETCLPWPESFLLPVPDLTLLPGCDLDIVGEHIVDVGGITLSERIDLSALGRRVELPLGAHTITWQIRLATGADEMSLNLPVEVVQTLSESCLCPAGVTLQVGTSEDDALLGGDLPLCARLLDGADFVRGSDAADWLWGEAGSDYLSGGAGDDVLSGGAGDDYLAGGTGVVILHGGPGDDVVHAVHSESAVIYGGLGGDELVGSPGDDTIYAGAGTLVVLAGSGDDVVVVFDACELSAGQQFDGGEGQDRLEVPVPVSEIEALGVQLSGFEEVVVDPDRSYLSDCFGS